MVYLASVCVALYVSHVIFFWNFLPRTHMFEFLFALVPLLYSVSVCPAYLVVLPLGAPANAIARYTRGVPPPGRPRESIKAHHRGVGGGGGAQVAAAALHAGQGATAGGPTAASNVGNRYRFSRCGHYAYGPGEASFASRGSGTCVPAPLVLGKGSSSWGGR
ncbi:unnamed protein product [Ectocarpus sp. 12 AP-2014]